MSEKFIVNQKCTFVIFKDKVEIKRLENADEYDVIGFMHKQSHHSMLFAISYEWYDIKRIDENGTETKLTPSWTWR